MNHTGMDFAVFMQRELPACFREMDGEVLTYQEAEKELTCAFPVKTTYLNPLQRMQGGFVAAAFDNVFGPLSLLVGGKPAVTVQMQVTYHRSLQVDDKLVITARAVKNGQQMLYMEARAFNGTGGLVASSSSSWMYVD